MRARLTTALAITVGLAACSSGGSTAPTTTLPGTATTTTSPSTTTTLPPPSTTEPTLTTEPVPATLPDNLTEAEFEQLRTEVIAAIGEADEVFKAVKASPSDPDTIASMSEIMTLERIDWVLGEFVIPYTSNGLAERSHPTIEPSVEYYLDTFTYDAESGTASIEHCTISAGSLVEVGGNLDGSDRVLDTGSGSLLVRTDVVWNGERWLDDGGVDLESVTDFTECLR